MDELMLRQALGQTPHAPSFEAILHRVPAPKRVRRAAVALALAPVVIGLVAILRPTPAPAPTLQQAQPQPAEMPAYAASTDWLLELPVLPEDAAPHVPKERATP